MKNSRQNTILNLINAYDIETQDELCERLRNAGFDITQATISRDIRELKLTKMVGASGRKHYVKIDRNNAEDDNRRHNTILREAIKSMECAKNILVIKANAGMGPAVGAAVDAMGLTEIVGSIAGDDTLMCVTKSDEECTMVKEKIELMLK